MKASTRMPQVAGNSRRSDAAASFPVEFPEIIQQAWRHVRALSL